jgi:hypothetical protein
MQWKVLSERSLYADGWLDLRLADVELPDGRHLDHRLLRMRASAGAVVLNEERCALLIWRHRFITGRWGWEMPIASVGLNPRPAPSTWIVARPHSPPPVRSSGLYLCGAQHL